MTNVNCEVIGDLLPLYVDGVCSDTSARLVEEHLETCPECQALLAEMSAALPGENTTSRSVETMAFRTMRGGILYLIVTAAVMLSCFAANMGGAWMGGPASEMQFAITCLYCVMWGFFTVGARNLRPLLKVSFILGLLTFLSAFGSLVCVLLNTGGFIAAFLSIFASVPFYGLRCCMEWEGLYAIATVISLVWLVFAGLRLRKLRRLLRGEESAG